MRIKYKILSYFLMLGAIVQAAQAPNFDIGIYSLNVNQKIEIPGARVYVTEDEVKYIELQKLLRDLGMTNTSWIDDEFKIDSGDIYNQEKIINLRKKIVYSRKGEIKFSDEIFEKDEKIYVKIDFLEKLLTLKTISEDEDRLKISIETDFRLPIELANIRKYRQEDFKNNEGKNTENIQQEGKLFEPGNLRLIYDYNKQLQADTTENKKLDAEYLGQVLYGEFETYYAVYPELKNYQTRLTYRDVYKNHSIIFGDVSTKLPRVLNGTVGEIRGISFVKDYNINSVYDNNSITISGYAPLGKFVELYQNNKLISYVDVTAGRYSFDDIPLIFSTDMFHVIIHNQDGSIKKEYLNRYYGERPEKKGEFGFNIYTGESSYDKYNQFIGEIDYGLSDRLTLKTGFYDLKYNAFYGKYNPREEETVKLGFLYTSEYSSSPYMLEVNTLKNSRDKEPDFTYKYNQNFPDYRFSFEGGNYSESTRERINKRYEISTQLNKTKFIKDNITAGVKFYSTEYENTGRRLDELGLVTRVGLSNLTAEYGVYKDLESGDILHDVGMRSYHFRKFITYAGVTHRDFGIFDETKYKVEVMNRATQNSQTRYKAYYEKSDRFGDVFGLSLDIDYSDWFTGRGEYRKTNGRSSLDVGYTVDKVISLSAPNEKVTNVENSSVSGRVYLDVNGDGKYDEKIDKALPRTEVTVLGRTSVTDKNGIYRVSNITPNVVQELKFKTQNPIYKGAVDLYKIKPIQASNMELDIPVYTRKIVSGVINFENNKLKNRYLTTLYLTAYNKKTGEQVEVVIPENDGFFMVNNLIAGEYILKVESVNNPGVILGEQEIEVRPETKEMNLELNIGGDEDEKENELVVAFAVAYNN